MVKPRSVAAFPYRSRNIWVASKIERLIKQRGWRAAQALAFCQIVSERIVDEQNVVFNGSYHTEQLAARMARVDWCIVPSVWWETFALVISEAWMFRRPVIASNVGALGERVRNEVDGMLFQVGDARSLARTMRRACTEEGLWERLVVGMKAPAGREAMVKGFWGVYREFSQPINFNYRHDRQAVSSDTEL